MKVEKMKESRRWLSWLPKALLATLLAGALAFVGCKSGSDDDDDDDGSAPPPIIPDDSDEDSDENYPIIMFKQDFEAVTDIADVVQVNKDTVNPTIALGDDDTKYAKIDFNTANIRGQTATIATDLPESLDADYKVEFDLKLAGPNASSASARQDAQFVLGAEAIATNVNTPYTGGYLFALSNYAVGNKPEDADVNHPNGQQNNLWALSLDGTGTEITLDRTKKYHFVITVDADKNVTAVAYSGSDYALGSASAGAEIAATSTVFSNINMLLGRASGFYYIDNIVVKSKQNIPIFTTAKIDVQNVTAIAANDNEKTEDIPNTVTLTANVDAAYASNEKAEVTNYEWSLSDEDKNYATLTPAEDGKTATLTGSNTTINKKDVTVRLKVTAGTGASAATMSITQPITVNAMQSLLSNVTLTGTGLTETETAGVYTLAIDVGASVDLTASATAKASDAADAASVAVRFTCPSTDSVTAKVGDENNTTVTLTGSSVVTDDRVTVTAKAGDASKDIVIKVTVNDKPLEAVNKITGETTLLCGIIDSTTLTAVIDPEGIYGVAYKWEVTGDCVKIDGADSEKTVTIVNILPSEPDGAQTAIVKVTATKGDVERVKEVPVTVKKPVKVEPALYSEDFADATNENVAGLFVPDFTGTFTVEDGAVRFTPTGEGNRGVELSFNLSESEEPLSNVVVEFDAQFNEGASNRDCELQVALGLGNVPSKTSNAALTADKGIVLVHAKKPNGGSVAFAEDNKAEIPFFKTSQGKLTTPAWCHYKVVITAADDSYSAKLTVTTDSDTLCEDEAVPCAGIPSYLHLLAGRLGSGVYLDNVEVYTLQ